LWSILREAASRGPSALAEADILVGLNIAFPIHISGMAEARVVK